jgi:F420-dependent oxidoreductase-like protein
MRIGVMIDEQSLTLSEIIEIAHAATGAGLSSLWMGHHYGWDPLVTLAAISGGVPGARLGSAIVPIYPQHPIALASQALSLQAVTGNQFTLGVGSGHREIIEDRFGYSYDHPARHLREYLTALAPLLRGEAVSYRGQTVSAEGAVFVGEALPPQLLVSALGTRTLAIAGELTDGTITNWAGPRTVADYIVPTITRAAGQRHPRIVAVLTVCVTTEVAAVRDWVATTFRRSGQFPSYRAMLDREGVNGVEDIVVAGDESVVERQLRRLVDAGATEFAVVPLGTPTERRRTIELMAHLDRRTAAP